jgi:hypothetical protein
MVRHSLYGARAFYFGMYLGFYISVIMYPNELKDYLKDGNYFWFVFFESLHAVSIYFFLTTADNPGYLESDEDGVLYQSVNSSEENSQDTDLEMGTIQNVEKPKEETSQPEYRGKKPAEDEIEDKIKSQPSFGNVRAIALEPNRGCEICKIKELPYRSRHCRDCNRCVRKFDHHCFWVGGCVGELNHYKFWIFLFLQSWTFIWTVDICMSGYDQAYSQFENDTKMQGHVSSVWVFFLIFLVLFILLTGGLCFYHSFLISTNQTTWEHTKQSQITYLKIYPRGLLPFYISVKENLRGVFCHGGKPTKWKLRQPTEIRDI